LSTAAASAKDIAVCGAGVLMAKGGGFMRYEKPEREIRS
jgi:hypothetical protein